MKIASLIHKDFLEMVYSKEIKVVSFDIFDTLVFRKVQEPATIFLNVGKRPEVLKIFHSPYAFRNMRIEAEKRARLLYDDLEEIDIFKIYEQFQCISSDIREKLIEYELEEEKKNIVINNHILEMIKIAKQFGKKVILVSDMYLKKNHIKDIVLVKIPNWGTLISDVYVSSELGRLKATGNLFKEVLEKEKVKPQEILHIGDKYLVDYLKPKELGIRTLHYDVDPMVESVFRVEKNYSGDDLGELFFIRRKACILNPYEKPSERVFFNIGAYLLGPILTSFSLWLKKLSEDKGLCQIYFVMREGWIFKRVFNKLYPEVETGLIYTSRRALLPAFLEVSKLIENLQELKFNEKLPIYRTATVNDIYEVLNIDISPNLKDFSNIELKKLLNKKELFKIFLDDIKGKLPIIKEKINEEQELIFRYFKSLKISDRSLFVDFGGGGSILYFISQILKTISKTASENTAYAMFFSRNEGYKTALEIPLYSFLNIKEKNKSLKLLERNCRVLEALLNMYFPTTIGYESKNGFVVPILRRTFKTSDCKYSFSALIDGINKFIEVFKKYSNIQYIEDEKIEGILSRFLEVPIFEEVSSLSNLHPDDGKEKSEPRKLVSTDDISLVKSIGILEFSKIIYTNPYYKQEEIYWPHGVIAYLDSGFISPFLFQTIDNDSLHSTAIEKIISLLKNANINKVNVYGAGEFFKYLSIRLERFGIEIIKVYDTKAYQGIYYIGKYKVEPLVAETVNEYPIVIASASFVDEIRNHIYKMFKKFSKSTTIVDLEKGLSIVERK